jgi:CubicO group peptidase (beta-lactamase class C family)
MRHPTSKLLIKLAAGLLGLVVIHSPSVARQAYPHTSESAQVDKLFEEWDRKGSPGASVGIFKDGRIIYARGYGMANLEYDIPNTPETVFRIGSTSKHFTAMCIALLIEQGKISIDDDIRLYLPEIPEYQSPIRIRHLLHHTSGIRNYEALMMLAGRDGETYKVPYYTDEDAVQMIARQRALNFNPGERYSYSNSNYFLLAEVIGKVSGTKTSEFARAQIFQPLGMSATHFHDDINVIVRNRASGYSPDANGGFRINMTQLEQIGTGSIYTTIEDFYKWDQNFYNNVLGKGSQDLIEMVETSGTLNNGDSTNYGFGLNITPFYGLRSIGHGGSFVGFRSYYLRFPDRQFSVVVLANQGPFPDYEIARDIALIYLRDQITEPIDVEQSTYRDDDEQAVMQVSAISLSDVQRAALVGEYFSPELQAYYRLFDDSGFVVLQVGRYYSAAISPLENDVFNWTHGTLEFQRDENNEISGFLLQSESIRDIEFTKVAPK